MDYMCSIYPVISSLFSLFDHIAADKIVLDSIAIMIQSTVSSKIWLGLKPAKHNFRRPGWKLPVANQGYTCGGIKRKRKRVQERLEGRVIEQTRQSVQKLRLMSEPILLWLWGQHGNPLHKEGASAKRAIRFSRG
jgi:hypothetical protein